MSSATSKIQITLTDARPILIDEERWPVIASAADWEGQYEFESFRKWKLFVRQKGEAYLVYGYFATSWQNENGVSHGFRATEVDLIHRIKEVANLIGCADPVALAQTCIGDLPAKEE